MNLNRKGTFPLSKTDPRLTGNLKLMIGDDNNVWIGTIGVNSPLSNYLYGMNPVSLEISNYGRDVRSLFQELPISTDSLYDIGSSTEYIAGPRISSMPTKYATSYFAPLWCSRYESIPNAFMVLHDPSSATHEWNNLYDPGYLKELLKRSRVVNVWDFSKGSLNEYLKNHYRYCCDLSLTGNDCFIPSIYQDSFPQGYQIFGINRVTGSYDIGFARGSGIVGEDLIKLYGNQDLLNPYLWNFEFQFNDRVNVGYGNYVGLWLNRVNVASTLLDWKEHNRHLDNVQIDDWHFNGFDSELFQVGTTSGSDVYIESFVNSVPQDSYEITGTSFFTLTGKTLVPHIVRDIEVHNFDGISFTAKLSDGPVGLAEFIGIDSSRSLHIPGFLLTPEGRDSLYIQLASWGNSTIFQISDHLTVRALASPSGNALYEWRIICDPGGCCSNDEGCKHVGITLDLSSNSWEIDYGPDGSKIIRMKFVGIHSTIEEGRKCFVSCDFFDKVEFTVDKVEFDIIENLTIITIVDSLGSNVHENFKESLNFFTVRYVERSYWFNYFDPRGGVVEVARNMASAFNKFSNRMFTAVPINDGIVIQSEHGGNLFHHLDIQYDFTRTDTSLRSLRFNGIGSRRHDVISGKGTVLFQRLRGTVPFFGSSAKRSRFAIPRGSGVHLKGSEVITTRRGYSSIGSSNLEGTFISTSPYIDEPILSGPNKMDLVSYRNFDRFDVLSISDFHDEIRPTTSGSVGIGYRYTGTLTKNTVIPGEDI